MIGERVLELRLSKNINLLTLSQLTGLSTNFLFDLENNTVPFTTDDIEKIASALDVSKSDIFSQWETDNYDDYYSAKTDEEKLKILNLFGIPEDLLNEYLCLIFDKIGNDCKQCAVTNAGCPANSEPIKNLPFYKSGLFWTIIGAIIGILQLLK